MGTKTTGKSVKKRPKATLPGVSGAKGFDNEKYLAEQHKAIRKRVEKFNDKLYLEFGGKVIYDYHASRVLPGFAPDVKMRLLEKMKDESEIIICVYAGDIERRKVRADFGITYDADTLRMIDEFRERGLKIAAVVITRFEGQSSAKVFKNKLERRGIKVYTHKFTKGYPTDIDVIVSDEGYGANDYIETERPVVIVTGPGPCSGKLATCLSQLYHENKRGVSAGYAKFETFPIWSIPLKHPVNVAYESATADLRDLNMIDPFHLEAYGETAVNYNRDVEVFPVLKRILERIRGKKSIYKSPTDMGVNRAGFGIVDDKAVREAAKQEIIRRYFRCACEYASGFADKEAVERTSLLVEEVGMRFEDRSTVLPARKAAEEAKKTGKGHDSIFCGAAIELPDGRVVTGKNSSLMHAASSVILNAIKALAGIPDNIHLLSRVTIDSISQMKKELSGRSVNVSLDVEETLIALSINAATSPTAQVAIEKLRELKGCEMHLSHMPT
ncbi:MAG: DUF1846 domain-containing protein, partial [Candidatus Omnitrophica bacterium]|nr:DUF1846 domain-containing protein [Candidatus Omnitrophota bacterium]